MYFFSSKGDMRAYNPRKNRNFMLWMLKPMMQAQQQYLIGWCKI